MGGTSSKDKRKDEFESFTSRVKSGIEDEIAKRMMLQREIQMSINIARARDTLQVFGSAWLTLVTGVTAATIAKRPVPHLVYVPIVVGGLALGNMADMAYGNKLQRVTKEAEYILTHEKYRFVPPVQAPFAKFYTAEEKAAMFDAATPVANLFPSNVLFPRSSK